MVFLSYLLKANALLLLFLLVYELFLRKETFFRVSRFFLLLGILIAAILPAVTAEHTEIIIEHSEPVPTETISLSEVSTVEPTATAPPNFWETISISSLLFYIYLGITLVLGLRFFIRLYKLGKTLQNPFGLATKEGIHYIKTNQNVGAFSFFNRIVYNPNLYSPQELKLVLRHEEAHVKDWHSLDVLLANLLVLLNWFNPLLLIYRKRMLENLEFIADSQATKTLTSPKSYQLALLKAASGQPLPYPITSFKNSFTANRIKKLTQGKSHKRTLWKLSLITPFLIGFFFIFQIETKAEIQYITEVPDITKMETDTLTSDLKISFILDATTQKKELDSLQKTLKEEFDLDFDYGNYQKNNAGELIDLSLTLTDAHGKSQTVSGSNEGKPIKPIGFESPTDREASFKLWVLENDEILKKSETEQLSADLSAHLKTAEYFMLNRKKTPVSKLKEKTFPLNNIKIEEKDSKKQLYITGKGLSTDDPIAAFEQQERKHSAFVFFKGQKEKVVPLIFHQRKKHSQHRADTFQKDIKTTTKFIDSEEFTISAKTSKQELKVLQKSLKEKYGLDFGFENLQFNKDGDLMRIHLWFVDEDGQKHQSTILGTETIPTIYLHPIGDSKGFKIRTESNQKSRFIKSSDLIIKGKPDKEIEKEMEKILKEKGFGGFTDSTSSENKTVQRIKSINVIKQEGDGIILIDGRSPKDDFHLKITPNTTDEQLEILKNKFKSKNVDFKYRTQRKADILTNIKIKLEDENDNFSSSDYKNNQGIPSFTIGYTDDKFYIR